LNIKTPPCEYGGKVSGEKRLLEERLKNGAVKTGCGTPLLYPHAMGRYVLSMENLYGQKGEKCREGGDGERKKKRHAV